MFKFITKCINQIFNKSEEFDRLKYIANYKSNKEIRSYIKDRLPIVSNDIYVVPPSLDDLPMSKVSEETKIKIRKLILEDLQNKDYVKDLDESIKSIKND